MTNNLYLIFLGIYTLIIMVNYNLLKNPKPYPPENIREEFKRGRERLGSYKYRGYPIIFSQGSLKVNLIG